MESYLPLRGLFKRMAETWKPWLIIAVAAGLVVLLSTLITLSGKDAVYAAASFSYDGIENGLNPMGGRFDVNEMKSTEVLSAAAAAAGLELGEEELAAVQSAITITGNVPKGIFERITGYTSAYSEKELGNTDTVRMRVYYPSQFTVAFQYAEAGMSAGKGAEFLNAALNAYGEYFYNKYGYNSAFEQTLRTFDYSSYDYEDAAEVLESNLEGLASYLKWLSAEDNARFVSTASGLSFDDLVEAIRMVQSENISSIMSYITMNHLTKDIPEYVTFYQFRIEDSERELAALQSHLEILNGRIAAYEKDRAFVMSGSGSGEGGGYEITQPSEMYNQLIEEKVHSQTQISSVQERIARYQRISAEIEAAEDTESQQEHIAALNEQFSLLDSKINSILDNTRETARDYFRTVKLKRGFQILSESAHSGPLLVVKGSLRPGVGIEAVVFGGYLLSAAAWVSRKRTKRTTEAESGT